MNSTKKIASFASVAAIALATALSLVMFNIRRAEAADITVNAGGSIQAAIDSAANGDTIIVNAGTYTEQLRVTKPLTIRGVGNVVIQTKSTALSANKGIDIQNTQDVTIENLTFDGENADPTRQTGVDINSVQNITLSNVTVRNYAKNGVAVTTQYGPSYVAGGNVTLDNVSVDNAGWAGVAFFTRSSTGNDVALEGVQFTGTTTVSNTQYGVQFGDSDGTEAITGVGGATIDLGTVVFAGNTANISNDNQDVVLAINSDSTVDGAPVTAAVFGALDVTIRDAASETDDSTASEGGNSSSPSGAVVPGVPNTATVR